MKENSIERDIHLLESYAGMTHKMNDNQGRPKLDQAIEHILSDYKRVLKENEELRADNYELNNRITDLLENIPVQKIKEKIEELDNERRKFTNDNVNNFYLQEFTRKYTQKSDHDYGVFGTPETITYCINNELLGRIEVLQDLLERSREDE